MTISIHNQKIIFNKIHNNKYNYDWDTYTNNQTKMKIICPVHGEFWQTPTDHKNKHSCPKCGTERGASIIRLNKEQILKDFRMIHNDKYQYDLTTYVNTQTKIKIVCPVHGEFWQSPRNHKRGNGCPECGQIKRIESNKTRILSFKDQLKRFNKIHNNKYTYDESTYVNASTKMRIICPIHGEFLQTPANHGRGHECPACGQIRRESGRGIEFSEQLSRFKAIHGNKYTYKESSYVDSTTKITIICPIHGKFKQKPQNHSGGQGCPKCKMSRGEVKISKYLNNKETIFISQKMFDDCVYKKRLQFDFYLPEYNICIEYDGEQHYKFVAGWHKTIKNFKISKLKDKIKTEYCIMKNIKLIRIPYYEFNNIELILEKEIFCTALNV